MDGGLSGHSINIHYVVITALGWAGGRVGYLHY